MRQSKAECEPTCKNKGVYCGETGENGYTRGKEHLEQYENKNENSTMETLQRDTQ